MGEIEAPRFRPRLGFRIERLFFRAVAAQDLISPIGPIAKHAFTQVHARALRLPCEQDARFISDCRKPALCDS
jgi:hypothetical protein